MKRLSVLPLTLLLFATTALAQTSSTDPDTLKAILSEIRQVRQDLQTTTRAAQRAQILIYRVQAQESIVRRMQERADDARSKLAQIRSEQKSRAASIKQIEEKRRRTETPTSEQKDLEEKLSFDWTKFRGARHACLGRTTPHSNNSIRFFLTTNVSNKWENLLFAQS